MKEAIKKYKTDRYGLNELCRLYEISKSTFKRHVNSTNIRGSPIKTLKLWVAAMFLALSKKDD